MIANKTNRKTLNSLLKDEGIYQELHTIVIREQLSVQLTALMKKKKLSKFQMASALKTSPAQLDRALDPELHISSTARTSLIEAIENRGEVVFARAANSWRS